MSDRRHVEYPPCARPAVGFTQVSSQDTLLPLLAPPHSPTWQQDPEPPLTHGYRGPKGFSHLLTQSRHLSFCFVHPIRNRWWCYSCLQT